MSKISLKHSGGNVVSLNAPTNTPDQADVAFKLPNADGSAGQFMKTDGSGNLSFDTVASNNTWVKLATTTVSSDVSTVEFTDSISGAFDTYKVYALSVTQYRGVVDGHELNMRIKDSSGSYTSSNYQFRRMTDQGNYNHDNTNHVSLTYNGIGNDTSNGGANIDEEAHSLVYMYSFVAGRRFQFRYETVFADNQGSFRYQTGAGGVRVSTATTGITLYSASDNIRAGIFTLYGIVT